MSDDVAAPVVDVPVFYATWVAIDLTESELKELADNLTPDILLGNVDALLPLMPLATEWENEARLDTNVAGIFLNVWPENLEEIDWLVARTSSVPGELPKLEVSGYYPIKKWGTLWFSYSFLREDNEWKWSGFSFDNALVLDAEFYNDLYNQTQSFVATIHDSFGEWRFEELYGQLKHATTNAGSESKFVADFEYIQASAAMYPQLFDSLLPDTLQIRSFDSLISDSQEEVFIVHGSVLTRSGAMIVFSVTVLSEEEAFAFFDIVNYQWHIVPQS